MLSPGISVLKSWQGIVEIVLRGACTVSSFILTMKLLIDYCSFSSCMHWCRPESSFAQPEHFFFFAGYSGRVGTASAGSGLQASRPKKCETTKKIDFDEARRTG